MEENRNIENFFKKRLDSQEFAYQESDWLLLEEKLNSAGETLSGSGSHFQASSALRTAIIIALSVTLAFLLGWFARILFEDDPVGKADPIRQSEPEYQITREMNSKVNDLSVTVPEDQAGSKKEQKTDHSDAQYIRHDNPALRTHDESTSMVSNSQLNNVLLSNREKKKLTGSNIPREDESGILTENPELDTATITKQDISFADRETIIQENQFLIRYGAEKNIDRGLIESSANAEIQKVYDVPVSITTDPGPRFLSRWMVGFSVGPDINSVGLMHEKSVSALIGGQVHFMALPRLRISAGILYSNKKYNTEAEYYKPPDGYWNNRTNGILPDKIIGSCRVIDIPVMLTYQYALKNQFAFTISTGLSSYILLDEYYDFEFESENSGAAEGWQTTENTRAPFSVLNLAMGVEMYTGERLIIAMEPYLKIPLRELGWGNVELYSLGIQAVLKYQLWQE